MWSSPSTGLYLTKTDFSSLPIAPRFLSHPLHPPSIRHYCTQNRPYNVDFTHTNTARLTAAVTSFQASGQQGEQDAWRHKTTLINSLTLLATSFRKVFGYSVVEQHDGAQWDITNCDRQDRPTVITLTSDSPLQTRERQSIIQDGHYQDGTRAGYVQDWVRDGPYRCVRSLDPGGSARSSAAQNHWPR
jgi:hypothetical protein